MKECRNATGDNVDIIEQEGIMLGSSHDGSPKNDAEAL